MTQPDRRDGRVIPGSPYALAGRDPWTPDGPGAPVPPWAAAPWEVQQAPRRRPRRGLAASLAVLAGVALLLLGVLGQRALQPTNRSGAAPAPAVPTAAPQPPQQRSAEPAVPAGTARFVPLARPLTVLDTRRGGPVPAGGEFALRLPPPAGAGPAAVALSVSVVGALKRGTVTLGKAALPQLRLPGPGATTTGLVVVPAAPGRAVTIRTTAGGHFVVDLVGRYIPVSEATTGGRTIVVPPQRVAHRVTAQVGHDGVVDALRPAAIPDRGVAAVLVRLTADVGRQGGVLRIGPAPDRLGTTLRWSPPTSADNKRQALAFVPLDRSGRLAVSYHGGFVLDVDVLAFVTDDTARAEVTGLFRPVAPGGPLTAAVPAGAGTRLDLTDRLPVAADRVAGALLSVTASGERSGVVSLGTPPGPAVASPGGGAAKAILAAVGTGPQLTVRSEVDTTVAVDLIGILLAR